MGAFGRPEQVLAEMRLDLDEFRAELKSAASASKKGGDAVEKGIGAGLKKAAAAAIVSKLSIESVKKAYELTRASIERLAQRRGDSDPVVRSFERAQGAVTSLFDSLVEGVFRSSVVQGALASVAEFAGSAADAATKLGERMDTFARKHAPQIAVAMTAVVALFESAKAGFAVLSAAFTTLAAVTASVAGKVTGFVASILESAQALSDLVGLGTFDALQEAAESTRSASELLGSTADITFRDAERKWAGVNERIEGLPSLLERTRRAIQEALEDPETPSAAPALLFGENTEAIVAAADDIAMKIGDSFSAGLSRIQALFVSLGEAAANFGAKLELQAASQAFAGLAAAAAQAERAFGASDRAAEVFRRVQLGVASAVAIVKGTMETAEAYSAAGDPTRSAGEVGLHTLAAAGFFAAAGLAGASAAGAFGSTASAASGVSAQSGTNETISAGQVAQPQTNITFVIEGNLIDNREFVREELIPAINQLVREEDVTVTATQARRAAQVGTI